MKKLKILRVCTFPTINRPTIGLHASKLCNINLATTILLTHNDNLDRPKIEGDFRLFEFGKPFELRLPKEEQKIFTEFFFIIRRIFGILKFSLYGVWLLFYNKVDIIHIHSPMYIIIAIVGFFAKKKIYITFHGADFHRIKKSLWYKLCSKIFTKVFSLSPFFIPTLSKIHGEDKVTFVHNGIDQDIYKNLNIVRKKQIIAVAQFKVEKGLKYLIEAFSNLKKNDFFKEYVLLIIGDGNLRKELENQIQFLGMRNHIYLPGKKKQNELIDLYNQSEVFALSSLQEGFPKVLLEAISCGCKIVSTDCGSANIILKGIKLAQPGSSEDLTNELSNSITSKNKFNIDISKFTWDSLRKIYYDEYNKINL